MDHKFFLINFSSRKVRKIYYNDPSVDTNEGETTIDLNSERKQGHVIVCIA